MVSRLISLTNYYKNQTKYSQKIKNKIINNIQLNSSLIESKQSFIKQTKSFELENWIVLNNFCVGRWISTEKEHFNMRVGSYSWGVWVKDTNFGAYRIHDCYGNLLAYRFDVLRDIKISKVANNQDKIEFFDLIVDIWMWPSLEGIVIPLEINVDDLDELSELQIKGIIDENDSKIIEKTTSELIFEPSKYIKIVDDAINTAIKLNDC